VGIDVYADAGTTNMTGGLYLAQVGTSYPYSTTLNLVASLPLVPTIQGTGTVWNIIDFISSPSLAPNSQYFIVIQSEGYPGPIAGVKQNSNVGNGRISLSALSKWWSVGIPTQITLDTNWSGSSYVNPQVVLRSCN
jgi:hypothetical protein